MRAASSRGRSTRIPRRPLAAIAALVALLSRSAPATADHPSVGFGAGLAGPIVTIPAGTLPAGAWAASARIELVRFDELSDEALEGYALADEDVHSVRELLVPSLALGIGLTDRVTLAARLPWLSRRSIREGHLEGGVPEVHDHGDAEGIGDLTLLSACRVPTEFAGGGLALLAGLKVPTGRTDAESEDGERFEVEHQPGSGSLDPLLGLAWSRPMGHHSIDANVLTAFATEGSRSTSLGSTIGYNVAISWRALEAAHDEHAHVHGAHAHDDGTAHPHHDEEAHAGPALDLVLELNGEWRTGSKEDGEELVNTGGNVIFLSPGARFSSGRCSAFVSAGVPIVEVLDGIQHETVVRLLAGLGMGWGGK